MDQKVSKSKFKPKAFEYFRLVSQTQKELIITDHDKPVLKIVPYKKENASLHKRLKSLRGLVQKYDAPLEPTGEHWGALSE